MTLNRVEVYGNHQEKCQLLMHNAQTALAALNVKAEIVCTVEPASQWRAFAPPVLAVNGSILSTGSVISSEQIQQLLSDLPQLIVG